jgi:NNP family nitrate/nitrite transporter-like MFS transporter
LVLIFAETKSLAGAIVVMVVFSLFVQAAEGSTFGIVPYVDPPSTGSISGIVGAGGNVGAVCFGFCFRQMNYDKAFMTMGIVILVAGILSCLIKIKGHAQLLWGTDSPAVKNRGTLSIPEQLPDMEVDGSGSAASTNAKDLSPDRHLEPDD